MTTLSKLIFAILMVVLVGSVIHSYGKTTELQSYIVKYKAYQDSVKVVLHTSDSIAKINVARADSLRADSIRAVEQDKQIKRLLNNAGSTQKEKARLEEELETLRNASPDTSQISLKKDTIITLLREDSTNAQQTIKKMQEKDLTQTNTISLLRRDNTDFKQRAENAEERLRNLPPCPPTGSDKWFFGLINKPTRKQSAIGGLVVGLVAGVLIAK